MLDLTSWEKYPDTHLIHACIEGKLRFVCPCLSPPPGLATSTRRQRSAPTGSLCPSDLAHWQQYHSRSVICSLLRHVQTKSDWDAFFLYRVPHVCIAIGACSVVLQQEHCQEAEILCFIYKPFHWRRLQWLNLVRNTFKNSTWCWSGTSFAPFLSQWKHNPSEEDILNFTVHSWAIQLKKLLYKGFEMSVQMLHVCPSASR